MNYGGIYDFNKNELISLSLFFYFQLINFFHYFFCVAIFIREFFEVVN